MITDATFSTSQAAVAPAVSGPQNGDTSDSLLGKMAHVLAGGAGVKRFNTAATHAYPMLGFYCLTETVVASAVGSPGFAFDASLNGITLPADSFWYWRLASITLTSGDILAHKA